MDVLDFGFGYPFISVYLTPITYDIVLRLTGTYDMSPHQKSN